MHKGAQLVARVGMSTGCYMHVYCESWTTTRRPCSPIIKPVLLDASIQKPAAEASCCPLRITCVHRLVHSSGGAFSGWYIHRLVHSSAGHSLTGAFIGWGMHVLWKLDKEGMVHLLHATCVCWCMQVRDAVQCVV